MPCSAARSISTSLNEVPTALMRKFKRWSSSTVFNLYPSLSQLVEYGQGVFLEAVSDHERARHDGLQPLEEVHSTGQHIKIVHDIEQLPELDAVAAQGGCPQSHQFIVIGLLRRSDFQFFDVELRLHGEPRLRRQETSHVTTKQPHGPGRLRRAQRRGARQRSWQDQLVRAQNPSDLDS